MPRPMQPQSAARKEAEHYFKRAEQHLAPSKRKTHEAERKAGATNTARSREPHPTTKTVKDVVDNLAPESGAELGPQHKRAPAVRAILRMTY